MILFLGIGYLTGVVVMAVLIAFGGYFDDRGQS